MAEHETTIPADLFGDALLSGWVGPVEWRLSPNTDAWETAIASGDARSINGRFRIRLTVGATAPPLDRVRLDLTRAEARHRLCVVLAAGERCPRRVGDGCGERVMGEFVPYGSPSHPLRLVPSTCPACSGSGYLRKPAPAWHLLPVGEGGTLPAEYAHHAPALLARHARRVAAGMGGIIGINALRPPMPEVSIAAGYALVDTDGTIRLPELAHA